MQTPSDICHVSFHISNLTDNVGAIIIDTGSSRVKAGYAGDDHPKHIFPSTCGVLLHTDQKSEDIPQSSQRHEITELTTLDTILSSNNTSNIPRLHPDSLRKRLIFGDSQRLPHPSMEILAPIQHGLVMDWDCAEALWDYTFKSQLHISPTEHPVLLSEPIYNTKARREKTVELFFERFQSPAMFLAKDAALTAMSAGKATALVVSSGSGATTVAPVFEGFVLHGPSQKTKIAGDSLDAFVQQLILSPKGVTQAPVNFLLERTPLPNGEILLRRRTELFAPGVIPPSESFLSLLRHEQLRDIKHSIVRLLESPFDSSVFGTVDMAEYELPDGQIVRIGAEQYIVGESLFNPELRLGSEVEVDLTPGFQFRGLHRMAWDVVDNSDVDIRKTLLHNVVLGGGTMTMKGMVPRFNKELNALLPLGVRAKMVLADTSFETGFAPWLGGAVLGSLSSFYPMWLTKADYEEHGASIVLRTCP